MEALELGLRAVGLFYVFAGIVGMRSMVMDRLLDQMLSGITLEPVPRKDVLRNRLMAFSVLAVGTGGMALMVLSLWAAPLFLLGAATQAIYLVWARTASVPEDELEKKGRAQTTNAALIYFGATVLVCVAASTGLLRPWLDPWALVIPVAGVFLVLTFGRHLVWKPRPDTRGWDDSKLLPREIPPAPARVRLAPMVGFYALRNAENDDGILFDDYLPQELGDRLYEWTLAFRASEDYDNREHWAQFPDAEAERRHRTEGAAIVAEMGAYFAEVEGPFYPDDIRYVAEEEPPAAS